MLSTGTVVINGDFDSKRWAQRTNQYIVGIRRMTDSRWIAILDLVRANLGSAKRRVRLQQGPPPDIDAEDGIVMPDSDPVYPE